MKDGGKKSEKVVPLNAFRCAEGGGQPVTDTPASPHAAVRGHV